jgi:hypothetical protein
MAMAILTKAVPVKAHWSVRLIERAYLVRVANNQARIGRLID